MYSAQTGGRYLGQLQRLQAFEPVAIVVDLDERTGSERSAVVSYGAGHIQALRYVFSVDVCLHSESAFCIICWIEPEPRKAGALTAFKVDDDSSSRFSGEDFSRQSRYVLEPWP